MKMISILFGTSLLLGPDPGPRAVAVAPDGFTTLETGMGEMQAQAIIHTIQLEKGAENGGERNRGFHCTGSHIPCSPVLDVRLKVQGKDVPVPSSVFADLSDVFEAELAQQGDRLVLQLHGGDASEAYLARIEFDADQVRVRKIYWKLDTTEPEEVTTYNVITLAD